MSFLNDIASFGGFGTLGLGAANGGGVSGAAKALGGGLGVDPSKIASIAKSIGNVSNSIADMGGAAPGFAAPALPAPQNHLQLLDMDSLRGLMQQFQGVRY